MATAEQLKEFRKKAVLSPNIGKHGKHWKTIAKENMRAEYERKLSEGVFDEISEIQLLAAKDKKNAVERMYVINQLIGKPLERSENKEEITLKINV